MPTDGAEARTTEITMKWPMRLRPRVRQARAPGWIARRLPGHGRRDDDDQQRAHEREVGWAMNSCR